ncbi:hypothetical protein J4Q44_G00107770 [Coregonus suidteri]|uniref:Uncharacterized protein n=1 Tax=Coregonus suidteri TaxID=861788 RepID=A0AAN8R0J2_9TELE
MSTQHEQNYNGWMLCQHWLGSPDMSRGLKRGRSGWISSQSGGPKHEQTIQERDFCCCLCWLCTNRMPGRACLTAPVGE